MPNVTKVTTTRDFALFNKVIFKSTTLYISTPYRRGSSHYEISDVFNEQGELMGTIDGHWFNYADKKLFKQVRRNDE